MFPRSAHWDVPARFDERASRDDGSPPGLRIRTGSPYQPAEPDREALIADLLTPDLPLDAASPLYGADRGSHQYVEARIEPGDTVTIVGGRCRSGRSPIRRRRTSVVAGRCPPTTRRWR